MTKFLLIRHGDTDAAGKMLMGWQPGWHLNSTGQKQAQRVGQRLAKAPIRAVFSSPLERAHETAEAIAAPHGLAPIVIEDFGEIRFGEWEGLTISELDQREDWRRYNTFRSGTRPPGGELMIDVQRRMVRKLQSLTPQHADSTVAVVSHGDPLRAVIAYYLGLGLDHMLRFEVFTASVSILELSEWTARVLSINETGEIPA